MPHLGQFSGFMTCGLRFVTVGTGLTFTLLQDPRMALVTVLPMALIPLPGVGISGTTHLIAFDYLRRRQGDPLPTGRGLASN